MLQRTDLPEAVVVAAHQDVLSAVDWGERVDEEDAAALLALHEELAPYRTEAEKALESREDPPA